jgi:DNA-binding NtrC family response regulator
MTEIEIAAARAMVDRSQGNKSDAARRLGISRTRLQRLLAGDAGGEAGREDTDT